MLSRKEAVSYSPYAMYFYKDEMKVLMQVIPYQHFTPSQEVQVFKLGSRQGFLFLVLRPPMSRMTRELCFRQFDFLEQKLKKSSHRSHYVSSLNLLTDLFTTLKRNLQFELLLDVKYV